MEMLSIKGVGRVRKKVFDTVRHLVANFCIKVNYLNPLFKEMTDGTIVLGMTATAEMTADGIGMSVLAEMKEVTDMTMTAEFGIAAVKTVDGIGSKLSKCRV